MKISLLDQSPLSEGWTGRMAVQATIEVARLADQLGLTRFWVSEHHNLPVLQSASPEIMLAAIGAVTQNIRIGAGGVMLPNHSPYRVAEHFRMLEALYPGRIDVAVGRASGGDAYSRSLLNPADPLGGQEKFAEQVNDLDAFLNDRVVHARAYPSVDAPPPMWLLTGASNKWSSDMAARLGLGLAIGNFINPTATEIVAVHYKRDFVPSPDFAKPYIILALSCVIAKDPEQICRLKKLSDVYRIHRDSGNYLKAVPSWETLETMQLSFAQEAYLATLSQREVVGLPEEVRTRIEEKAALFRADEVMLTFMAPSLEERLEIVDLLAETFELKP